MSGTIIAAPLPPQLGLTPLLRVAAPLGTQTMLSTMQSGHPFTSSGTGTVLLNDTSDAIIGTQAIKITTDGAGGASIVGATFSTIDLTRYWLRVWLKVDSATHLSSVRLRVGSDLTTNYYTTDNLGGATSPGGAGGTSVLNPGDWMCITLDLFQRQGATGTPSKTAITAIGLVAIDDAGGTIAVHWGGLALVPKPCDLYPYGVLSMTFDDGFTSQYTNGLPKLLQSGYAATAYVIQDQISSAGGVTNSGLYMNLAQLHALEDYGGWEVAAHAATGADHGTGFATLATNGQLDADLSAHKAWLLANGFRGADHLAWPRGLYNDAAIAIARKYFSAARTINFRPYGNDLPPIDRYRIRCRGLDMTNLLSVYESVIDDAVTQNSWFIMYTHEIYPTGGSAPGGSGTALDVATFNGLIDYIKSTYPNTPVLPLGDVLRSGVALGTILAENARVQVLNAGTLVGTRRGLNVLPGANLTVAGADNASNERVDLTLAAYDPFKGMTIPGETSPRQVSNSNVTVVGGTGYFTYFVPQTTFTITQLSVGVNGAASGPTLSRLGLYTVDGSGNLTLVARTASDTTWFTTGSAVATRTLNTTGGYPASYQLVAGTKYALGMLNVGGTTQPTLKCAASPGWSGMLLLPPVLAFQQGSLSDLPTTQPYSSGAVSNQAIWFLAS